MNVPSYNALFTSRDKLVKTVMELCENLDKGGGGGGGSDITEITAENKDAAIAASTNLYSNGECLLLQKKIITNF